MQRQQTLHQNQICCEYFHQFSHILDLHCSCSFKNSLSNRNDDKKWNLPPSPKSEVRLDKALFNSGTCRLATVISMLGWIWLKLMLPFWKVLDNSDSTGKTSVKMYKAAIQSGAFNFFNSPLAVASSTSSHKHKSIESRSSWAAFKALLKDNHRVLHAFWRRFVTFFLKHPCSSELASAFLEPRCTQRDASLFPLLQLFGQGLPLQ